MAAQYLAIPEREIVPDNHHRDATGNPDQDQTVHQERLVAEKNDGKDKHQDRADDPVLDKRQAEDLRVPENVVELFVPHFCERRVHHEDEPDRDGDRCRPDREAGDHCGHCGREVPDGNSRCHRKEDPEREVPIDYGEMPRGVIHMRSPVSTQSIFSRISVASRTSAGHFVTKSFLSRAVTYSS